MLGWMFIVETLAAAVTRSPITRDEAQKNELARWQTSMNGGKWLHDLAQQGLAEKIAFGGYPDAYMLRASTFKALFKHGIPKHDGPAVFGDGYVTSGSHVSEIELHSDRIAAVEDSLWLVVYMWDLS